MTAGKVGLFSGIQLRHTALERNKRCVLAYLYVYIISFIIIDICIEQFKCQYTCVHMYVSELALLTDPRKCH